MASTINADTSNGVIITPDTSGEIELQANGVTKAKVTANGLQDANGNSLRGGSFRNLIINGDMRIAQRGTSKTGITTSGYNTVDRWTSRIGSTGTWTETQDTNVPSGQGFSNSFKLHCTTANASLSAGSLMTLQYRFEGQHLQHLKKGTSNAESVTLSFWVKSNKTGTYIVDLYDTDNTRTISKSYTIDTADTWEKKILTYAGDISGAFNNDNARSMDINMWLAAGSDYSSGTLSTSWKSAVQADRAVGQVNLADSTSNYISITGVQLEVGEGASDFEFLPYDVQLQRCQRYYQKIIDRDNDGSGRMWLWNISGGNLWRRGYIVYTTTMRATPTGTLDATAGGGGTFVATPSFSNSSEKSGAIIADLTTGNDGYYAFVDNLYLDAEL